jgi:O-acetyl-ADP-ribose deacetylase (regulator of RNase III)
MAKYATYIEQQLQRVRIEVGDITRLEVDAIVNAANQSLLGGGGVDGAIHRAAGPELKAHNQTLGGCQTGLAVATPAFNLEERGIKRIIHTVGPVWHGDENAKLGYTREDNLLASCYQQCLSIAAQEALSSVAFPAISTGVYGFPVKRAAKIAISHTLAFLKDHDLPQSVVFCCFSDSDAAVYRELIDTRWQWMTE